MSVNPIFMTVTGPSCSGKSYLVNHLIEKYPDQFQVLLSDTTRKPRPGEVNGVEYNFVTEQYFEENMQNEGYCQFVQFNGISYGTSKSDLQSIFDAGKTPIRIVEPTGVTQFKFVASDMDFSVFSIFVSGSPELCMSRWLQRYYETIYDSKDADDLIADHEFYVRRMTSCFLHEFDWIDHQPYNFYLDCDTQDFSSMSHSLSRIATGKVNMSVANGLAPYPHKEAA